MPYSILIAEDSPEEAAEVAQIAEALLDCSTERAADRYEALAKLRSKKYDAVIVDLNLGGVFEGRLLLEAIETHFAAPPGTIIVSAMGGESRARELKGSFRFITDVFAKSDIKDVPGAFRVALQAAVARGRVGPAAALPAEALTPMPKPSGRLRESTKLKLWIALIGAAAAIATAAIRSCTG